MTHYSTPCKVTVALRVFHKTEGTPNRHAGLLAVEDKIAGHVTLNGFSD